MFHQNFFVIKRSCTIWRLTLCIHNVNYCHLTNTMICNTHAATHCSNSFNDNRNAVHNMLIMCIWYECERVVSQQHITTHNRQYNSKAKLTARINVRIISRLNSLLQSTSDELSQVYVRNYTETWVAVHQGVWEWTPREMEFTKPEEFLYMPDVL